jgi:hypothetical protein
VSWDTFWGWAIVVIVAAGLLFMVFVMVVGEPSDGYNSHPGGHPLIQEQYP